MGVGGHSNQKVIEVGNHEAPRYRHVLGGDVYLEEEGGDWRLLGGAHRVQGADVGGVVEDLGTGPLRQKGGDPIDNARGYLGGQ